MVSNFCTFAISDTDVVGSAPACTFLTKLSSDCCICSVAVLAQRIPVNQTNYRFLSSCFGTVPRSMFLSCLRSCFTSDGYVDSKYRNPLPKNVELLHQSFVSCSPKNAMQQPLSPLDLYPFCFHQYLPWAVFFNYDIDFQRLVEALNTVAQKYLLLCGRLRTDAKGRYVVKVSISVLKHSVESFVKVGSTKRKKYNFPVTEMKAEMQMAEAILSHGQTTTKSADFPVHPDQLPFYLESLDLEAIHKYAILHSLSKPQFYFRGQDPFLSVRLTHFSDGCCLAISMSHFLMDGMRFSELYRDISRAYCGKEVPMRDINRQYMTLEGFSQQFCPEDKVGCIIPEATLTEREPLSFKQYPEESSSVEVLYLSKQIIDDLKSRVAQFIPKESFVSTADLIQALLWMLSCESNAASGDIEDSTDLEITGTSSMYVAELYCNGLGIIPSNYLGNATIHPHIDAGNDLKSKPLIELLASLALLTRQKQIELRENPKEVFKLLVENCFPFTSAPVNLRSAVSNFCKCANSDTDFGGGPPALCLRYPSLPVTATAWYVSTAFQEGEILLTQTLTTKQRERIKNSSVLKECAPGIRSLFDDFGTVELKDLMK